MKTFIRWPGNKSRYIHHILPHVPPTFNTYIEPFVGSGSLFLHIHPEKWIINDINMDLINVWIQVKTNHTKIKANFQDFEIVFHQLDKPAKLLYCKHMLNKLLLLKYTCYRASLYMLSKFCAYMGFILINNKYTITALDTKIYHGKRLYFLSEKYYENLKHVSTFLNQTTGIITNQDYKRALRYAKKGDFVFLDPPYVEAHDYKFNYNKDEHVDDTFVHDLVKMLRSLDKKGVMWMMTQADTPFIRSVFQRYKIHTFPVYRRQLNLHKNELIIKNY